MIKAAVLRKAKKISIETFEIPKKLRNDQVLVKIRYAGICGSQVMEYLGKRGKDKYLPHSFGHEASGIVVNTGVNVKKIKKNDSVILSWIKGHGKDLGGFSLKNKKGQKINFGPISTLATHAIVSENRVFKKPKKMTDLEASLYGCAIPTGVGMVLNQIKKIKKNSKICLIGAGGVGMASLLALKKKSIKIFLIEKNNFKISSLKKFKINFIKLSKIKKYYDKFDYCIDASGNSKMIEHGFKLINSSGELIFASHPEHSKKISIDPHDLIKGKRILGSWGGGCELDYDINKIFKFFDNKNIFSSKAKISFFNINNLDNAFKAIISGKTNRVIVKF